MGQPPAAMARTSATQDTRQRGAAHHSFPITCLAEAVDLALARERHQPDLARLAGLEAHGRAGGDVEAVAARLGAVELQGRVGLGEVVVRADLDRPVAGVGDRQRDRRRGRR